MGGKSPIERFINETISDVGVKNMIIASSQNLLRYQFIVYNSM